MQWDVQVMAESGQVVDVREPGGGRKPWGSGDVRKPFRIERREMSVLDAVALRETSLAHKVDDQLLGADPGNMLAQFADDLLISEISRRTRTNADMTDRLRDALFGPGGG